MGAIRLAVVSLAVGLVATAAAEAGPISPLYLTTHSGHLYVIQGDAVVDSWAISFDEGPLAVTTTVKIGAQGIGTGGREYLPDGTPTGRIFPSTGCCLGDGTTDGIYNYAVGGGPSYPPPRSGLIRFDADWANPVGLGPFGVQLEASGIAADPRDGTLWISTASSSVVLFHMTPQGDFLPGFLNTHLPGSDGISSLALDLADNSLWLFSRRDSQGVFDPQLLQYSLVNGTPSLIGSLRLTGLVPDPVIGSAEFAVTTVPAPVPEPSTLALLTVGVVGLSRKWTRRGTRP